MASNQEVTFPLRYWVNNEPKPIVMAEPKPIVMAEPKPIVMAEASGHFVDVLFSFLTLPLGTIIQLRNTSDQQLVIGCINNLFKSVESLDPHVFRNNICQRMLLSPRNPLEESYQRLKVKIDDTEPTKYYVCHICSKATNFYLSTFDKVKCHCGNMMMRQIDLMVEPYGENGVFVEGDAMFLILDDLTVLRSTPSDSFKPPLQHGHKEFKMMEEKSIEVDKNKIFSILKQALSSKSPLGDVLLEKSPLSDVLLENGESNSASDPFSPHTRPSHWKDYVEIKVIMRKSNNKILFVEADADFVDFLVSFLTLPLGSILYLVKGKLSLGSIDNLYKSVKNLDPSWFIESSNKSLLNPKVATHFGCGSNRLHDSVEDSTKYWYGTGEVKDNRGRVISEKPMISRKKDMLKDPKEIKLLDPRSSDGGRKSDMIGFMKRPCLFVVSDDLEVKAMTSTSSIPCPFMESNQSLDDLEEHFVEIRKSQALNLLIASLRYKKAAFTESLSHLLRKWKYLRYIPFYGLLGRKIKRHRKKKVMEDKERSRKK